MKAFRPYFVALSLAAAALGSCGRSYYSFQSKAPAYLGAAPIASAPATPPAASAPAAPEVAHAAAAVVQLMPATASKNARASLPAPTTASVGALAAANAGRPSLVRRLALRGVVKQVAKAAARQQNTAGVAHTAATKGSLTVAVVGLIALLVGIIANLSFLTVIGIILLVVGIILFVLKLL